MKPYISQVIENNGKTYRLPLPPKYRELIDCVRTLGIKTVEDEGDMRVIGYETLMDLPIPDKYADVFLVESIAEDLSSFTPEQVKAISVMCKQFDFGYMQIWRITNCVTPIVIGGTSK